MDQLETLGKQIEIPVFVKRGETDVLKIAREALDFAKAKPEGVRANVLIFDTAGRLHTQHNLMDELKKIKRVLHKLNIDAPHETLLVLDASVGQNALNQARQFHQSVGLTGIVMTKLDGTAKGGILFAIAHELGIPFRYIGVGEGIDDLRTFDAQQLIEAMFQDDHI